MTERVTYAVRFPVVAALAALAAVAAAGAVATPFPGRLLFLVVAVGAAAEALRSVLLRPTLVADREGVRVVVGLRTEYVPWHDVEVVTTLRPPSGGGRVRRRADALEIDLGDRLLAVSGYRLGVPAATAAEALAGLKSFSG